MTYGTEEYGAFGESEESIEKVIAAAKSRFLDDIGMRTAQIARATGNDALATTIDQENLLMAFVCDSALKVLLASNRAAISEYKIASAGPAALKIVADFAVNKLAGMYVTVLSESHKILGNSDQDSDDCVALQLVDDWRDVDPSFISTCSICNAPENPTEGAQTAELLMMVPSELVLAVKYRVMSEWFSSCGNENQAAIFRTKYEADLAERRRTRDSKTAKRQYRPI